MDTSSFFTSMNNSSKNTRPVFYAILLAVFSNLALPAPANACGPIDESYHYFNLFVPEWMFGQEYSPAFYTSNEYQNIWSSPDYSDDNLQSWLSFFRNSVGREALERVLTGRYTENYGSVERDALVRSVLFKGSKLPAGQVKASQRYLLLALEIEKLADRANTPWSYEPDTLGREETLALIGRLETALKQEKDPFLKERYAFQLIKSYRYSGQPEKAVEAFNGHFRGSAEKSLIYYWALDHLAGIQLQLGQKAQGFYNFLTVFSACRSRRYSAYYSFNIPSEEIWEDTYALCGAPEEKALMHFLRGSKEGILGLHDAEEIFSLVGNHEWLRLLAAREVNKMESLNLSYFNEEPIESLFQNLEQNGSLLQSPEHAEYAARLLQFASTVYYNYRGDHFWAATKAYLEFLLGRFDAARATLAENKDMKGPYNKVKREIELALFIFGRKQFSAEEEGFIAREIISLFDDERGTFYTDRNNEEFILDLLAYKARQRGDVLMADFLGRNLLSTFKVDPRIGRVDSLLEFIGRPRHTGLELLALKHYTGNQGPWADYSDMPDSLLEKMKYEVLDIKGTLLMRSPGRLEEALDIFESLPAGYDFPLEHNPFNMRINDCVWDCPPRTSASFTRITFVRKLIEIRDIARNSNSAVDYYLLGNAYYNMSYFGPAYYLMNYFRSGAYYSGYWDNTQALEYYQQAIRYAPGEEEAARYCFMAAKAEQNLFFKYMAENRPPDEYWWGKYTIDEWDPEAYARFQEDISRLGYRKYFGRLCNEYKDTDFFQRAARECKYLEYYARRN
ncbi:MAG: hypothetical protein KDD06_24375 [Phaeodactylibacter sp.]|nr:hypothetical protein [Phaeodactylibacter sp.]